MNTNRTAKKDFLGHTARFSNNVFENCVQTFYENGEIVKIQKNPLGFITKVESDSSFFEYDYDTGGKLLASKDLKNNIHTFYFYDDFGRCVEKRGENFDFFYKYDDYGFVKKISEEKSGFWVRFSYDFAGREVLRTFSNGGQITTGFDESGKKCFSEIRNSLGIIISADYVIYDERGRVKALSDQNMNIREYEYDEKGRLISTCYPYSDEVRLFALNEALNSGAYITAENPAGKNVYFEKEILSKLSGVLKLAKNSSRLSDVQYSWIEKYSYTETGAVKTLENPFGKIIYEYDALGRLEKKHASNSVTEGMSFFGMTTAALKKFPLGIQRFPLLTEILCGRFL